jgi:transposase
VLDEFAATTHMSRARGRCKKGKRLDAKLPRGHWKVLTTIAAMTVDGMLTSVTVDAATDAEVFRAFLAHALLPSLRPGQVVVMDNLSSHHAAGVEAMIEAAGCRVLYLPPYSPDYNPIENAISKIKSVLKSLAARTVDALRSAVEQAVKSVTASDAAGFFRHCGYPATPT